VQFEDDIVRWTGAGVPHAMRLARAAIDDAVLPDLSAERLHRALEHDDGDIVASSCGSYPAPGARTVACAWSFRGIRSVRRATAWSSNARAPRRSDVFEADDLGTELVPSAPPAVRHLNIRYD
jgi:hypothetical protein